MQRLKTYNVNSNQIGLITLTPSESKTNSSFYFNRFWIKYNQLSGRNAITGERERKGEKYYGPILSNLVVGKIIEILSIS